MKLQELNNYHTKNYTNMLGKVEIKVKELANDKFAGKEISNDDVYDQTLQLVDKAVKQFNNKEYTSRFSFDEGDIFLIVNPISTKYGNSIRKAKEQSK
jgi:hypothetical protein